MNLKAILAIFTILALTAINSSAHSRGYCANYCAMRQQGKYPP
uniref:Uncharacterized protein n=1 Tax=Parastrongyloides trichosuri TaxID=131310 RepID=A0A0N5A096_PARTI